MRAEADEQISAFLENRPGCVADLCAALIERKINIKAMCVLETHDIGTLRMVVDNVELAKEVFSAAGAAYIVVPVVSIVIPNKPGAFTRIARTMAKANINIEYVYATAAPGTAQSVGVFRVSDQKAALELDFEE
ncbi:MAG: hypothetical protein ACE5E6_07350 [Phycisphaerae bacterium]